jgi:hypothetical protein
MGMQQPNNPQNITHLIVRAKEGDSDAIGELYENFRLGVYRYLYYRTGETQAADDLTSEVFLRMIRSLPGIAWIKAHFKDGCIRLHTTCSPIITAAQTVNTRWSWRKN